MSSLRLKPGKRGLRATLLASAVAAAFVAFAGAGTASAAVSCTGSNIIGEGASLQKIAQLNVWIPQFEGEVCNTGTFPQVEYKPEGSGAGLKAWGANTGEGMNRTRQYIGTDDAPTAAQIENIKKAAGGGDVLVIPVAQTAIAVVVNPPSGCTVTAMTGKDVERAFRGVNKSWSEIGTATGTCSSPITRVVRKDGSGTTYQFKNYLGLYNSSNLPCVGKSWKQIQPIEDTVTGAPNTTWPEDCEGKDLTDVVRPANNGGGEVAKKVNATEGSIGYASLPDAQANGAKFVSLQNNGQAPLEEATFGSPVIAGVEPGKGVANCAATKYAVPKEARRTGTGLNADWSQVFGANASIGGENYPLCTLTYILAFHGYKAAGFKFAEEVTVRDYVNGYIVFGGQTALETTQTNYSPVPFVENNATFNAQAAMRKAASLISP